jgi:hypothetical protein
MEDMRNTHDREVEDDESPEVVLEPSSIDVGAGSTGSAVPNAGGDGAAGPAEVEVVAVVGGVGDVGDVGDVGALAVSVLVLVFVFVVVTVSFCVVVVVPPPAPVSASGGNTYPAIHSYAHPLVSDPSRSSALSV